MGHSLARDGALRPYARPFRQISQVGHGFRVVDGLRERVAAVQTKTAREPLLDLERPAVMYGESDVICDIEIAELRKQPSAEGAVENRLAARDHARDHHSVDQCASLRSIE